MAICFRVRGWFVVHGVDESARETFISAREGSRGKVHTEQVACAVGGGVEKAKCEGGEECRGLF